MLYTTTPDNQQLTVALDGQQNVERGANIKVYFDPARCHVFSADGVAIQAHEEHAAVNGGGSVSDRYHAAS